MFRFLSYTNIVSVVVASMNESGTGEESGDDNITSAEIVLTSFLIINGPFKVA